MGVVGMVAGLTTVGSERSSSLSRQGADTPYLGVDLAAALEQQREDRTRTRK
jgi:hypothetical protein